MKRVFVLLIMIILLLLSGCASKGNIPVIEDPAAREKVAKIAMRRIGQAVGKNNPEHIDEMKEYANNILAQEVPEAAGDMFMVGLRHLAKRVAGDALLADDLVDVLYLFGLDLENISKEKLDMNDVNFKLVMVIVKAFKTGLEAT